MGHNEQLASSDHDDDTNLQSSPIETAANIKSNSQNEQLPYNCYDEEVASDNQVNALYSIQKNQSLDESALEINHRSSVKAGNTVKFARQLSSPTKFKLRRLNMAGMMVSTVEDSSPPRLFANSWSFGSLKASSRLDGVVDEEEATMEDEMNQPLHANTGKSNLSKIKSMEFNLDMIELAPSDDKNDATEKQKVDDEEDTTSVEQLTDLQTDSEELEESVENNKEKMVIHHEDIEASSDFHNVPEHDPSEGDENVGESKKNPMHFFGWFVVLADENHPCHGV